MDEKIAKINKADKLSLIEKLAKEIETEKDFDKSVAKFAAAAELVKSALADGAKQKGKVMEIIKEVDGYVERELRVEEE